MNRTAVRERRPPRLEAPAGRLRRELRRVRRDPADRDAVHDARVAARRLLAAGEMWAYGAPGWPRLRKQLPRFIRRLGRVRNFDVALQLLARGAAADRAVRKALARALRKRLGGRRARLRAWLDASRLRRFEGRVEALLDEVRRQPLQLAPGPVDLAPYFARILSLTAGVHWTLEPAVAHEVRRELRRLRYAHETLEGAYRPAEFRRAVDALRAAQEAAGDWHDRVMIAELAGKTVRRGRVSVPLSPLLARLSGEAKEFSRDFERAVAKLLSLRPAMQGEDLP
jgi:CHAD domain-containing protein